MSRTGLWNLIENHRLYQDMKKNQTQEELVSRMKKRVTIEAIGSDVFQATSTMPIRGTISFTLSFKDTDPHTAQQITDKLAGLYIKENEVNLEKKIEDTASFLVEETNISRKKLIDLEETIANFKTKHLHEMPEQLEYNFEMAAELEADIDSQQSELQSLMERKAETEGQLKIVNPHLPDEIEEEREETEAQLQALRFEYLRRRASLSSEHPDLIRMKAEIEGLEKLVGREAYYEDLERHLADLNALYMEQSEKLREDHPDLIALKDELEVVHAELDSMEKQMEQEKIAVNAPDNPTGIPLQTKSQTQNDNTEATTEKLENLQKMLDAVQERIDKNPEIEETYINLTREYELLNAEYIEKAGKLRKNHPDLITMKAELDVVQKELMELQNQMVPKKATAKATAKAPDNPAYITLQTTLNTLNVNIDATKERLVNLRERRDVVQKRIDNTPKTEKAYISLTREYEHLKTIHSQQLEEMAAVKAAQEVKDMKKGDRFRIVDKASFPQKPSDQNVLIIIILGLIISLSLSVGILFLAENADMSIRTDSELSGATGFPVLVSVPFIKNTYDKMNTFFSIVFQLIIILLFIVGAIWAANYYYLNYAIPRLP